MNAEQVLALRSRFSFFQIPTLQRQIGGSSFLSLRSRSAYG